MWINFSGRSWKSWSKTSRTHGSRLKIDRAITGTTTTTLFSSISRVFSLFCLFVFYVFAWKYLGLPVCFYLCLKPIFCEIHAFFKGKTHSLHGFIPTSYTVWFSLSLRIYHLEMVQNQSNIFQFCVFDFYLVLLWVDIVFIKSWSLFDLGKKPISRMYLFPIFCFCHTHGFFFNGKNPFPAWLM